MEIKDSKKILIVDDDEFLLGIYATNFKDKSFEVLTARDGQEAWDMINAGNIPDIIFTGITMPRMTGFEFIMKLQADPNLVNIPVVVNSHRGRPEDEKLAKKIGVDDFIIQGTTTPVETVRRIELLLGIQKSYKIVLTPNKGDAVALTSFLNKQQGASCDLSGNKEIFLELIPKPEKGEFTIKISC